MAERHKAGKLITKDTKTVTTTKIERSVLVTKKESSVVKKSSYLQSESKKSS